MTRTPPASRTATELAGAVLGGVVRAVAAARPTRKPLHPRGEVRHGRLYRRGAEEPTGVEFLDAVGEDDVLVRESRAIGLPQGWPDVQGLAVRVPTPGGGHGDLLFATTGSGRLTRFVLTLSRSTYGRPMTTLLPYATTAGPVVLRATAQHADRVELAFAVGDRRWRPFADLLLSAPAPDAEIDFDPVRHTLPGLDQYDAVHRLREPAYRAARGSRGDG